MLSSLYQFFYTAGQHALEHLWFPVLIWTILCAIVYLVLKRSDGLNPLYHYHLRVATLLALPAGIIASVVFQHGLSMLNTQEPIETALIVVANPIQTSVNSNIASSEAYLPMNDPNLWIGLFTALILISGLLLLGRVLWDMAKLRKLTSSISLIPLEDLGRNSEEFSSSQISVSFHDNPYVPFTYGWRKPVVVLPEKLRSQPEKLQMALNHELVHVQRRDYLLQLVLTVMESLFWFHPLVRVTNKEIDTYREISCDQQVLNSAPYSVKSYANLLLELLPLQSGVGRLSVSMAVRESTLKQRIKTMKYHKLHRSSMRQSMIFLMLMVVGITLPIACSDMRGPSEMTEEEILSSAMKFENTAVTINGLDAGERKNPVQVRGTNGLLITTTDHGSFVVSPSYFDGSEKAGTVSGNTAEFTINQMKVQLQTSSDISEGKTMPLFARHFSIEKEMKFGVFTEIPRRILESEDLSSFAKLMAIPPSPPNPSDSSSEDDFFVVVEEMPELIGGLSSIQSRIQYPEMARRAGIEGRVIVQFIVNEQGYVEDPSVVRGIGGGADEEALRVMSEVRFKPGMQRGRPVRVQFSLPIIFKLSDSDFGSVTPEDPTTTTQKMQTSLWSSENADGSVNIKLYVRRQNGDPLAGANVQWGNRGAVTNPEGVAIISNVEMRNDPIRITFVGMEEVNLSADRIQTSLN